MIISYNKFDIRCEWSVQLPVVNLKKQLTKRDLQFGRNLTLSWPWNWLLYFNLELAIEQWK